MKNRDSSIQWLTLIGSLCGVALDFCGPGWWRDLDIILDETQKRHMRVWMLDDRQFPTGFAGGLIASKYPQHRRRFLNYVAIDALGPDKCTSFLVHSLLKHPETDRLEAVVATRRLDPGTRWENARTDVINLIDVTDYVQDGCIGRSRRDCTALSLYIPIWTKVCLCSIPFLEMRLPVRSKVAISHIMNITVICLVAHSPDFSPTSLSLQTAAGTRCPAATYIFPLVLSFS